jgi:hypothetical protein
MMTDVLKGAIAGAQAGIVMAFVSEAAFRLRIFGSSLLLIDGAFAYRLSKKKIHPAYMYLAGIPIHLATSSVFGAVYVGAVTLLKLPICSPYGVSLYFTFLYLSMLFLALPIAGQGMAGKRAGRQTWFEQAVLHIVFGLGYYLLLRISGVCG